MTASPSTNTNTTSRCRQPPPPPPPPPLPPLPPPPPPPSAAAPRRLLSRRVCRRRQADAALPRGHPSSGILGLSGCRLSGCGLSGCGVSGCGVSGSVLGVPLGLRRHHHTHHAPPPPWTRARSSKLQALGQAGRAQPASPAPKRLLGHAARARHRAAPRAARVMMTRDRDRAWKVKVLQL
jgi:hypothetical protein